MWEAEPETTEAEQEALELAIGDFAAAMATDNATTKAIKDYFQKRSGKRPEKVYSFSSATKYSGAVFEDASYVLGAPEFILRDQYAAYSERIEYWGRQGYRVLVFATYEGVLDGEKLTADVRPMGMILLANPIRENAKETFAYFAEQGVKIKVISGDNPVTVSEVAKEAGIEDAEDYVDASTLTDEKALFAAAERYTVFGRVTPDQKRQLVSAMKGRGHTVAMTGDGVNDVLALKDADCSIAMASGSDAASQVGTACASGVRFFQDAVSGSGRTPGGQQHRAHRKPFPCETYFLPVFVDFLDYFDGKLSAGAVADFSDQYVYDRHSGLCDVPGAQYGSD